MNPSTSLSSPPSGKHLEPPRVAVGKVSGGGGCRIRLEQLPLYSLLLCSHSPSRKLAALPQKGAKSLGPRKYTPHNLSPLSRVQGPSEEEGTPRRQ